MLSSVFSDPLLSERLLGDLSAWIGTQRWYSAKSGEETTLEPTGWVRLTSSPERTTTLATFRSQRGQRLAIPLTWTTCSEGIEGLETSLISTIETPTDDRVWIADATAIDQGRQDLVRALFTSTAESETATLTPTLHSPTAEAFTRDLCEITSTQRLSGEQSNTSIIVNTARGPQYMVKLFRHLDEGDNPDITIHRALTEAGNARIAPLFAAAAVHDREGSSDLAFVNEFFPGVEDAWRSALVSAAHHEDFTEEARGLGGALAHVHEDLARELGTREATPELVGATVDGIEERLRTFVSDVPQLAEYAGRLRERYESARSVPWPSFQRIHGDLHLGQVLYSERLGWILLDFEGEPLRPLSERVQMDSPLRDVAGLLRSFDYAAGYVRLNEDIDASHWARSAREAFLEGYVDTLRERRGELPASMTELVKLFELDKAAYEAVYEAGHRPDWLGIPLSALARLTA